jgi:DDE superfamily endonuclease
VLNPHFTHTAVCLVEARGAGPLSCSTQLGSGNVTLLSSMSVRGMGPSLAVEDSTTREVFETYIEQVLAPTLREGQVVVMDNLSSHKGSRVRELIEGRGFKSFSTCHPTRRISIRSKKPSRRSRGSLEKQRPAPERRW